MMPAGATIEIEALLTEAVEQLIAGEVEVGKAVLQDYFNATMGFEKLAKALAGMTTVIEPPSSGNG
jgi:hypothetical protein